MFVNKNVHKYEQNNLTDEHLKHIIITIRRGIKWEFITINYSIY